MEFGGCGSTILGIAAYLMERFSLPSLNFFFPEKSALPEQILQAASGWTINSSEMIKIVDLEKTVSLFAPQSEKEKIPDITSLKALPETERVAALFGALSESPFNIFIWPLDLI